MRKLFSSRLIKNKNLYSNIRSFASIHPNAKLIAQSDFYMEEGNRLLELGSIDLAMDAYHRAIKIYPTANSYYNIGNVYLQMHKPMDAKNFYLKSAELEKRPDVYVNLGNLELTLLKNPEKAIEYYNTAIDIDGENDGEVYYNLGIAYDKVGKFSESLKSLEKAKELMGNDEKTKEQVERIISKVNYSLKNQIKS
jgi:tetratricopeptide (TPR) repeat protein